MENKPLLRGVLHHYGALVALGAGAVLVLATKAPRSRAAAAGYALSALLLFTVSAAYHRITWQPEARKVMRRADHASIFLLIAGTYTPICLLGLPPATGERLLAWVWLGAALGVLQSLFWVDAPKPVSAGLYLALGWALVPYFNQIWGVLTAADLFFLFGGGACYTLGAIFYAAKRPNPLPGVFGYHEVFHALTLVAFVCHFLLVARLVLAEPGSLLLR